MGEEKSYLERLWARAMDRLGNLASFVPMIAEQIKVKLSENDVDKIRVHAVELKEASRAQIALADAILEATDDGTIDLVEGSDIALKIERMLDEYQDVATGVDQDDPQ